MANFISRRPLGLVAATDDDVFGSRDEELPNPFSPPRGGLQEGCAAIFHRSIEMSDLQFKEAVLKEQVDRRMRRGKTPVNELTKEERLPIEGSHEMHKDVAPHFLKMYTALKAALATDKGNGLAAATKVKTVGVASAYRPSSYDRRLWEG